MLLQRGLSVIAELLVKMGPTKSCPEPSGAVRSRPDTVLTPPGAVRMPPGSVEMTVPIPSAAAGLSVVTV